MKTVLNKVLVTVVTIMIALTLWPHIGRAAPPAQGPPPVDPGDKALVDRLQRQTGGQVRVSYHEETGKVRFIGAQPAQAIPQPAVLPGGASVAEASRGFLDTYGKLFGLEDPSRELTVMKEQQLADGRAFVRFQQVYQDIPIVGGELVVQTDSKRNVISANGEVLPDLELSVKPAIAADAARQTALGKVAKDYDLSPDDLTTTNPELWIYNPALLGGPGRRVSRLVWRLEVTPHVNLPIRELVLVDAQLGFILLQFNQIDMAKYRVVCDNDSNSSLPCTTPTRSEGDPPTGINDVDLAYDYAGDTYDFYFNEHGRDSLDNAGYVLISTVRYCGSGYPCPYPNAFWNGTQMVYGAGFPAADDVVAHELTHGMTDFTSHLFYYYQSGAINESLSDVWGEFVDLTNGQGNDSPAVRWQLGEELPASIGVIRNMQDPTLFGDPDQMITSRYYCAEGDMGGVHSNSGVNNKAVYLMTDGGTFNGYTVTGLGIPKVADLYYEVQAQMLTSSSSYLDLYDALIQASFNLGYSAAEQQAIRNALDAVEMNQRPCSDPPEAVMCSTGQTATHLFFDDLENISSGNWTSAALQGTDAWYYPQIPNPLNIDTTYATSGIYNFWGYNRPYTADYYMAMTSNVPLPANAFLHFKHAWGFEDYYSTAYDGGVVEYSTNSGLSWTDASALFIDNGYNGAISSSPSNPLGGRSAFVHESRGYTASRLDLSSLAGHDVRFRFRIGTDSSVDAWGWFIDDIGLYACHDALGTPAIGGLPDQTLPMNGSLDNAIDLWTYASDIEDANANLTFTISNSPDPSAGVTIDSNRYIDINPAPGWTGTTTVTVQVADTAGLTDTDSFIVEVKEVANCGFFDGFESGALRTAWGISTTNEGRVQVSSSYPYSGTYSVLLDDSVSGGNDSLAGLILNADLSGRSQVDLEFWWREFGDENDPEDGVFISDDDGATWHPVLSFNNGPTVFRSDVVDIAAAAAANGLTLNSHFKIKFQFYDDYPVTSDGYAIDSVRLTCGPVSSNTPPNLTGLLDQALPMNGSLDNAIYLPAHASDAEDAVANLSFSITHITDANAGVTIDSNRYIDINPATDWSGSADVTVVVTDTGGLTDTDSFTVVVIRPPVNNQPSLAGLPDQTLPMNGSLDNAIDLWAYASDGEDSDVDLRFSISNVSDVRAGVTMDASGRYIDINPATNWSGSASVTVEVHDTGGMTVTGTFTVNVRSMVYLPLVSE